MDTEVNQPADCKIGYRLHHLGSQTEEGGGGKLGRNWAGINPALSEFIDKGRGDQVTFFPSSCLGRWRGARWLHWSRLRCAAVTPPFPDTAVLCYSRLGTPSWEPRWQFKMSLESTSREAIKTWESLWKDRIKWYAFWCKTHFKTIQLLFFFHDRHFPWSLWSSFACMHLKISFAQKQTHLLHFLVNFWKYILFSLPKSCLKLPPGTMPVHQ